MVETLSKRYWIMENDPLISQKSCSKSLRPAIHGHRWDSREGPLTPAPVHAAFRSDESLLYVRCLPRPTQNPD